MQKGLQEVLSVYGPRRQDITFSRDCSGYGGYLYDLAATR